MSTLLIKNARYIVSCDDQDSLHERCNLFIRDQAIEYIGPALRQADQVIDASRMAVYPGLINTHHHLYQLFSRNLPEVQKMELFPWLVTLYEVWKNLDEEVVSWSSLAGMGELLKNGCTTCFDHHYVFPERSGDLIAAQFRSADTVGMRFHASRGSMDLSKKDGGLPPDSVVQTIDAILADSERLVRVWHDESRFSMRQVAATDELYRQPVALSKQTDTVMLYPAQSAEAFLPKDAKDEDIRKTVDLKEDVVNAPITAGQELGTLTITYNDQVCAQVPLLAQADVSASRFLVAKAAVEAFFAKTWVKLALVAIVVLVIVFVLWLKLGRRSRRYGSRGGKRRQQRAYRGRRRW